MNPYQSPNAIDNPETVSNALPPSRRHIRSALAYAAWGTGTFLLSLLVLIDLLIQANLPGGVFYATFALGPILGVCGAIATKHRTRLKVCLIIATFCLLPLQFIILGIALLWTKGFEGVH